MGVLYNTCRIGPLVRVFFEQLVAFHRVTRVTGVIDEAGGEEFALILEGGRVKNEVPQVSVDLNWTTGSVTTWAEPTVALRTACALIIS